ncbi:MAG: preprotein translocase subunit SecE, partial [Gammaproteobacteria bacterium]
AERRSPKPQVGGSIPSWPASERQGVRVTGVIMADKIKLVLAVLVLAGAVGAFYYFGNESVLLRVFGILAGLAVATAIVYQTAEGRRAWSFLGDSRTEIRKVVWPTGKETNQTTLLVIAMVIVVAILLWLLDMLLLWLVRMLTVSGG